MFPDGPLGRVPGLEGTVVTKQPIDQVAATSAPTRPDFHPGRASPRGDQGLHPNMGRSFPNRGPLTDECVDLWSLTQ
jgi:hypothetical protein